jgi:hypothetical protein
VLLPCDVVLVQMSSYDLMYPRVAAAAWVRTGTACNIHVLLLSSKRQNVMLCRCHAVQVSSYDLINPGGYYSARVRVLGS